MSDIKVISKQVIEENPSLIGKAIADLCDDIEKSNGDFEKIKDRKFWKRLTNNNTRDLAENCIKQNDTIAAFLNIIQGIIFLCMNNIAVIGAVMESLEEQENANGLRDNKYLHMAKEYLSEALNSAKRSTNNEKNISLLKDELAKTYKNQEDIKNISDLNDSKHDMEIEKIKDNLSKTFLNQENSNRKINSLKGKTEDIKNISDLNDSKHDMEIEKIKDELNMILTNNIKWKRIVHINIVATIFLAILFVMNIINII